MARARRAHERSEVLEGAPLRYAPENELGVVFLFADYARRHGFRVDEIHPGFPDCVAYTRAGGRAKPVRIEFEFKSRYFKDHGHSARGCDYIVCWEDNWLDKPKHLKVIELRSEYDHGVNVWVQPNAEDRDEELSKRKVVDWSVASESKAGDLVVFYLNRPSKCFAYVGRIVGPIRKGRAGWKPGKDVMAKVRVIARLKTPVYLQELRLHPVLRTSSMLRGALRGRPRITEHWPFLRDMIARRNPPLRKLLKKL